MHDVWIWIWGGFSLLLWMEHLWRRKVCNCNFRWNGKHSSEMKNRLNAIRSILIELLRYLIAANHVICEWLELCLSTEKWNTYFWPLPMNVKRVYNLPWQFLVSDLAILYPDLPFYLWQMCVQWVNERPVFRFQKPPTSNTKLNENDCWPI